MATDERSRHELYARLEQVLGSEEAATLMEHLPPVGWADVATKHDLEVQLVATEHRLLATLRAELATLQRHLVTTLISTVLVALFTVAGLAFAAATLV